MHRPCLTLLAAASAAIRCLPAFAVDPWIITGDVVITEPMEVREIIVALDGSLTVRDVPEPGLQVTGSVFAINDASIRFEDSVIQFMSTYNGQYALAGVESSTIEVVGCDYRVPNGVQHALIISDEGEMRVEDTDFKDVQLISGGTARLGARRLNGNFEVLVQESSMMELTDIPRDSGQGRLWVWVEFPGGSVADYTPPMPGFISDWTFPPPESEGIDQHVVVHRCEAMLWPMLVREDARLTLRDIPEDNWVVVGLYLPESATVDGLINDVSYVSKELFYNQEISIVNASIDTWNLYPQRDARVRVRDSVLGEILAFGGSQVIVERTTIDGSGGFLGARDRARLALYDSTVTCTIEAVHDSTIELHDSVADPYPQDQTGSFTRFGAYDRGRLFADQTPVNTRPVLGGDGVIGVTSLLPPDYPPVEPFPLYGTVGLFSPGSGPVLSSWRLEAVPRLVTHAVPIAEGQRNVEEAEVATWAGADQNIDHMLRTVLTDSWGRTLVGRLWVQGDGPRVQRGGPRRSP